jgi:hypothetical protein
VGWYVTLFSGQKIKVGCTFLICTPGVGGLVWNMKTKTRIPPRRKEIKSTVEQRMSVRSACGPEIRCRVIDDGAAEFWAVRVQNVSTGGISLLLDRIVPAGKLVTVEIHNDNRKSSCRRQVRVIYALQVPGSGMMMGGAFCPELTDNDLANLC